MEEDTKSINEDALLFNAADNSFNDICFDFHRRIETICGKKSESKTGLAKEINQAWDVYAAELSGVLRLVGKEWTAGVLNGWSHHRLVQKYSDLIIELNDLCEKSLANAGIASNGKTEND